MCFKVLDRMRLFAPQALNTCISLGIKEAQDASSCREIPSPLLGFKKMDLNYFFLFIKDFRM